MVISTGNNYLPVDVKSATSYVPLAVIIRNVCPLDNWVGSEGFAAVKLIEYTLPFEPYTDNAFCVLCPEPIKHIGALNTDTSTVLHAHTSTDCNVPNACEPVIVSASICDINEDISCPK